MLGKTNIKVKPNKKFDYDNFIQSTGTQYIDTGIVPKSTTRMEIKYKHNDISTGQLMGWCSNNNLEAFQIGFGSADSEFSSIVNSVCKKTFTGIPKDTEIHTFDIKSGSQKFDGIEYGTDSIGDTASSGQTLYLFGLHVEWDTIPPGLCKCNLYYCKIYENDTLVRDFKPAKDGSGVYCLYDEVQKKYYYNKGSGSFIGGASV